VKVLFYLKKSNFKKNKGKKLGFNRYVFSYRLIIGETRYFGDEFG
jgi:hypothetical protein